MVFKESLNLYHYGIICYNFKKREEKEMSNNSFSQVKRRYNTTMKRADAPTITYALIEWLDKKYTDKTITTEIALNTSLGVKVADVVVSNGHSVAYEIKSAFDTTKRLDAQLEGFSEWFEYVYFVYWGEKYDVENLHINENIGLIQAYWSGGGICFRMQKKAKINRKSTQNTIASFLWKKELRYFLNRKQIKYKMNYDKESLERLFCKYYGKRESVNIFRHILKHRFASGFEKFKELGDLKVFTKHKVDINYTLEYS